MRIARRLLQLAGVVGLGTALTLPATAASVPRAVPPAPRSATVRGIALGPTESFAIGLHPMAAPVVVQVRADADLEACAAGHDGGPPEAGGSSWPRFGPCVPFDAAGRISLSPSFEGHVAFLVRGQHGARVNVRRLHVTWTPVDTYFEVLPPGLAPYEAGPAITFRPDASGVVGAQAYGLDYAATPHVRVRVAQSGHRVPKRTPQPTALDAQAYGPILLGTPVGVTTKNTGSAPVRLRILVAWDSRFVSS